MQGAGASRPEDYVAKRTIIDGVYVLTREIARGGMSVVCEADVDLSRFDYTTLYAYTQVQGATHLERRRKAEDLAKELHGRSLDPATVRGILEAHGIPVPGATVAVKVGRGDSDPARFEAEWKNLLCLSHRNVIEVYGGGLYMKRPYYAMELLPGILPLERVKAELAIANKIELVLHAAAGLSYLHSQGIIHRDVKPANLLVFEVTPARYAAKVVDLGLAKSLGGDVDLTRSEAVMGTPHYMAPEQMVSSKMADERSDVYSLGATLYEFVTGLRPFSDKTTVYEVIAAVTAGERPRPAREAAPDLPEVLDGIIECAMARDPARRYDGMDALAQDLRTYVAQEQTQLLSAPSFVDVDTSLSKPSVGQGEYVFEERAASTTPPPLPLYLPEAETVAPVASPRAEPPARRRRSSRIVILAGVALIAILTVLGIVALIMQREPMDTAPAGGTPGTPTALTPPPPIGNTFTNSIGMQFVRIKAGEFDMGSPRNEDGRKPNETLHRVRLTTDFYMGAYEVTRGQFAAFVRDSGYKSEAEKRGRGSAWDGSKLDYVAGASWQDVGFEQTDEHPVTCVSWHDARALCDWLSDKEGRPYRLPTEAEWEYACRSGTTTRFSFGDDVGQLHRYANFADRSAPIANTKSGPDRSQDDGHAFTAPVASYEPNAWGLYDMHGNVTELCSDLCDRTTDHGYMKAYPPKMAIDPTGPPSGPYRVLRGGSWYYGTGSLGYFRSAARDSNAPVARDAYHGFRVVLELPDGASTGATWQEARRKADGAYDANRFDEASRLYGALLADVMHEEDMGGQAWLGQFSDWIRQRQSLVQFIIDRSKLPAERQIELTQTKLAELNPKYDGKGRFETNEGQITGAELRECGLRDLGPLKGLPLSYLDCGKNSIVDLSPLKGMQLTSLTASSNPVKDITPLRGMPLEELVLNGAQVEDISVLAGMPLHGLGLEGTGVSDIGSLEDMPLTSLNLSETATRDIAVLHGMQLETLGLRHTLVSDISVLRGMPLRVLTLANNKVSDITVLAAAPLETLQLSPENITKGMDAIRAIKSIETISNKPAAEFWEEYDAQRKGTDGKGAAVTHPIQPGPPVSGTALVQMPAKLPGLRSWTLETRTMRGECWAVAYRPDGRNLAGAAYDGTVRVWDAQSLAPLRILAGHDAQVTDLVWSHDGTVLASTSEDKTARIWDVGKGRLVSTLTGHTDTVTSAAWSPDGKVLATIGSCTDQTLRIWQLAGKRGPRRKELEFRPRSVDWSPDGRSLAVGGDSRGLVIFDAATGRLRPSVPLEASGACAVAWSPDSALLAAGTLDATVELWDGKTGGSAGTLTVSARPTPINALAWSSGSGRLASLAESAPGGRLVVWDVRLRKRVQEFTSLPVSSAMDLSMSPDGKRFAIAYGNCIRLLDSESDHVAATIPSQKNRGFALAWSPGGERLAASMGVSGVGLWETDGWALRTTLAGESRGVAWAPDGRTVAVGGRGVVHLYGAEAAELLHVLKGHKDEVRGLAWSPDGQALASSALSGHVMLWQPPGRQATPTVLKPRTPGSYQPIVWAATSGLLFVGGNRVVEVWDPAGLRLVRTIEGLTWPPYALALSPDEQTVAAGDDDPYKRRIRLFDVRSGSARANLAGESEYTDALAWSPGGGLLAAGGRDGIVRLLDVRKGTLHRRLPAGHGHYARGLAWSPDGRRLASCGADGTIRLWDPEGEVALPVLVPFPAAGKYAVIGPNGNYRGSPDIETELVYVVMTDDGEQHTLSPAEFAATYGWQNDPSRVGAMP